MVAFEPGSLQCDIGYLNNYLGYLCKLLPVLTEASDRFNESWIITALWMSNPLKKTTLVCL